MGPQGSIFTGKTLDEAVTRGLEELGLRRAEAMISVIEEGRAGGFLGLGARPYKVRIMPRPGGAPHEPESARPRGESRRGRDDRGRGGRDGRRGERGGRGGRDDSRGRRDDRGERRGDRPAREEVRAERGGPAPSGERPEGRRADRREDRGGIERRDDRRAGPREERHDDRRETRGDSPEFRGERHAEPRAEVDDSPAVERSAPQAHEEAAREGGGRRRRRRGRRGGRGRSEDAPVVTETPRVDRPEAEDEFREVEEVAAETMPEPLAVPASASSGTERPWAPTALDESRSALPPEQLAAEGRRWTEQLLAAMGFEAKVSASAEGDRVDVMAEVTADEELLTGAKGEVRQALQHLLNRMINRGEGSHYHLQLEINDFWQRRERELEGIARSMADEAVQRGDEVVSEYLNAQERRIIHVTLREDARVRTYALGTGMIKRIAVAPADFQGGPRDDE